MLPVIPAMLFNAACIARHPVAAGDRTDSTVVGSRALRRRQYSTSPRRQFDGVEPRLPAGMRCAVCGGNLFCGNETMAGKRLMGSFPAFSIDSRGENGYSRG